MPARSCFARNWLQSKSSKDSHSTCCRKAKPMQILEFRNPSRRGFPGAGRNQNANVLRRGAE